jgi:hypothetical protein
MGAVSLCYCATLLDQRHHPMSGGMPERRTLKIGSFSIQVNANAGRGIGDWARMIYFLLPRTRN